MTRSDGTYQAVLDRIEDDLAVFLVEDEATQLEYSLEELSEYDVELSEGDIVEVAIQDGELIAITPEIRETQSRRDRMRDKFDRLAERPPDRDHE